MGKGNGNGSRGRGRGIPRNNSSDIVSMEAGQLNHHSDDEHDWLKKQILELQSAVKALEKRVDQETLVADSSFIRNLSPRIVQELGAKKTLQESVYKAVVEAKLENRLNTLVKKGVDGVVHSSVEEIKSNVTERVKNSILEDQEFCKLFCNSCIKSSQVYSSLLREENDASLKRRCRIAKIQFYETKVNEIKKNSLTVTEKTAVSAYIHNLFSQISTVVDFPSHWKACSKKVCVAFGWRVVIAAVTYFGSAVVIVKGLNFWSYRRELKDLDLKQGEKECEQKEKQGEKEGEKKEKQWRICGKTLRIWGNN